MLNKTFYLSQIISTKNFTSRFCIGKKEKAHCTDRHEFNTDETHSSSPTLEENVKRSNDQLAFPGRYGVIIKMLFHKSEEKMIKKMKMT